MDQIILSNKTNIPIIILMYNKFIVQDLLCYTEFIQLLQNPGVFRFRSHWYIIVFIFWTHWYIMIIIFWTHRYIMIFMFPAHIHNVFDCDGAFQVTVCLATKTSMRARAGAHTTLCRRRNERPAVAEAGPRLRYDLTS